MIGRYGWHQTGPNRDSLAMYIIRRPSEKERKREDHERLELRSQEGSKLQRITALPTIDVVARFSIGKA